jgi:REP element-mobilizing transposase RayT
MFAHSNSARYGIVQKPELVLAHFIFTEKEFPEELSKYYWKPYFWSRSYMVLSTGRATIDVIKKYIEEQGE